MISYETFRSLIEKIEAKDRKLSEISELLRSDVLFETSCLDEAVQMLEMLCGDDDEMISYWMWELNYGQGWQPGCVTQADGTDLKLATVKDLYECLADDQQEACP